MKLNRYQFSLMTLLNLVVDRNSAAESNVKSSATSCITIAQLGERQ